LTDAKSYDECCEQYLELYGRDKVEALLIKECQRISVRSDEIDRCGQQSREFIQCLASLQNVIDLVMLTCSDDTKQAVNEFKYERILERLRAAESDSPDSVNEKSDFCGVLNPRIVKILSVNRIYTYKQLSSYTKDELKKLRNIGDKAIEEIEAELRKHDMDFRKID
jgi:Bacterial RNA polymerase, alpha chain C terminal domain.